jgi:putative hemolysin
LYEAVLSGLPAAEDLHYGYRFVLMALVIALNGFFAAAEAALISSRLSRLKSLAERGQLGASAALSLLANPERLLSVGQVGVTLASLALGWVGEETLHSFFFNVLGLVFPPAGRLALNLSCLAAAFALMTFLHVIFGEVVPKNIAISTSERLAVLVAPVLLVFYKAVEPFVWIIERTAAAVSRLAVVRGEPRSGAHSAEELKFILSATRAAGHLSQFEQESIQNVLDLQDYAVREVMVPRNSLVMVSIDADIDEVLAVVSESRYSRLPVFEESRENILGIVHVKDVLDFWTQRRQSNLRRRPVAPFDLRSILRKVPVIPETKPLTQVLDELRARHAHVAFVVDEFGTITGLITMEDVMEQIFGEIEDEFDLPFPRPALDAASTEVEGTILIRDLDTQYGIDLPADVEFETLAGFILYELGRIPEPGDAVVHEGHRFTVTEMDFNRIARVRIERLPEPGQN